MAYVVAGKPYQYLKDAAAACKAYSSIVIDYAKAHGVSYQEALDHYYKKNVVGIVLDGVNYPTLKDALASMDVTYRAFASWKCNHCKGSTQQEALDLYYDWMQKREKPLIVVGKHSYTKVREAVEATGWTWAAALKYRQSHGGTWQETIDDWLCNAPLQSIRKLSSATEVVLRYTGLDGHRYYSCICPVCRRSLLITQQAVVKFTHGESFCKEHENPLASL